MVEKLVYDTYAGPGTSTTGQIMKTNSGKISITLFVTCLNHL